MWGLETIIAMNEPKVTAQKEARKMEPNERELTSGELAEKYNFDQHPECTLSDWKWAVTNEDTRRGYWEWVAARIEETQD